jgi:hypothetical protein
MLNVTYENQTASRNEWKYPISEDAIMVCAIARTRTLTDAIIAILRANGHTVTKA